MHAHLPPDNALRLTPYFHLLNLAHGVTPLRCAGDVDGTATPTVQAGLESGTFLGPRLYTSGPFVAIGEDRIGAIEKGRLADGLIFREDPTESLDAVGTLEAVILRGQLYTRESLDRKIAESQEHYRAFPVGPLSKFLARKALQRATDG